MLIPALVLAAVRGQVRVLWRGGYPQPVVVADDDDDLDVELEEMGGVKEDLASNEMEAGDAYEGDPTMTLHAAEMEEELEVEVDVETDVM